MRLTPLDIQVVPTAHDYRVLRLRQVLMNLLTNAVRFTERGGITVRTARQEDGLQVSVHDTGRGIAPEDLPRLFLKFQQAQERPCTSPCPCPSRCPGPWGRRGRQIATGCPKLAESAWWPTAIRI